MVLRAWADRGGRWDESDRYKDPVPVRLSKDKAGLLALLKSPQPSQLEFWFPLMVEEEEGKATQWNLSTLRAVLSWDDPVVMLDALVACDGPKWLEVLDDMETKVYSRSKEDAIKAAFNTLTMTWAVSVDGPRERAYVLFLKNEEQRSGNQQISCCHDSMV